MIVKKTCIYLLFVFHSPTIQQSTEYISQSTTPPTTSSSSSAAFQTTQSTTTTTTTTHPSDVVEGERESIDINSLMDDAMNDTDEMVRIKWFYICLLYTSPSPRDRG